MPCCCGNMSDLDHSLQKHFLWCSFALKTVLITSRQTHRKTCWTWKHCNTYLKHSCITQSYVYKRIIGSLTSWLRRDWNFEESKWLTTLQTTRRGTRSPRSTTKGTLAARWCSSVSWWSSAVARRSARLQNAMEMCKRSAAGSRPHLSRVRSRKDLHLHMHDRLMQFLPYAESTGTCSKNTFNWCKLETIIYQKTKTVAELYILFSNESFKYLAERIPTAWLHTTILHCRHGVMIVGSVVFYTCFGKSLSSCHLTTSSFLTSQLGHAGICGKLQTC